MLITGCLEDTKAGKSSTGGDCPAGRDCSAPEESSADRDSGRSIERSPDLSQD